jgi:hypothetical protein
MDKDTKQMKSKRCLVWVGGELPHFAFATYQILTEKGKWHIEGHLGYEATHWMPITPPGE